MGLIGSILSSIFEAPDRYQENAEKIMERTKLRSRTVGSDKEYEMKLARELGDINWIKSIEEEDKFIKQEEADKKAKEEEKKEATSNKDKVELTIENFETESTLSMDGLVNVAQNSGNISEDQVIAVRDMANDLLCDTKSNFSLNESITQFLSKAINVESIITKNKTEIQEEDNGNNPFGNVAGYSLTGGDNPFETTTGNSDDHKQDAFE